MSVSTGDVSRDNVSPVHLGLLPHPDVPVQACALDRWDYKIMHELELSGCQESVTGRHKIAHILLTNFTLREVLRLLLEPRLIVLWMNVPRKSDRVEVVGFRLALHPHLIELSTNAARSGEDNCTTTGAKSRRQTSPNIFKISNERCLVYD